MSADVRKPQLSVVGAGDASKEVYEAAREVGRRIAQRGGVVVCGGLGGVMEAACRGAAEAQGSSIAIVPQADIGAANRWATSVVATGLGHARNVLVVQSGQAVIALPGEAGTLSEVALALKTGRPVIAVNAWGEVEGVEVCATPEEAGALAFTRMEQAGQ